MAVTRWYLVSPLLGVRQFPLNPKSGSLPSRKKNVTAQSTTNGAPAVFEGRQPTSTITFEVALLQESHHDFFNDWFDTPYAATIQTHLGQSLNVYCTDLDIKPKNRHNYPWAADATVTCLAWW